jgi:hypothetical protein
VAKDKPYLSVCAMYRDLAEYLREWVEFHLLVGVERFFLYDNGSRDDHREVLAPYLDEGTVVLHDWPLPFKPGLERSVEHCIEHHREDSRWIAFLDLDEFLFSPTVRPLPEILPEYEQFPGVVVNWAMFGSSGHVTKPPGLVIENYHSRERENNYVKSIVDPRRVVKVPVNPHFFLYDEGFAVNEAKEPVKHGVRSERVAFERLRINHYWSKSQEEVRRKFEQWEEAGFPRPWRLFEGTDSRSAEVRDDVIKAYVPALRAAIEARERDVSASVSSTSQS